MMENDVLTMRICKSIIGSNCFLRIIKSVPSKKAESLKAWLAMVGRERIWMHCCRICSLSCLRSSLQRAVRRICRCCERKTINRTEKGRNHAVSPFVC